MLCDDRLSSTRYKTPSIAMLTESTSVDQASREAARRLLPPAPRPCFLASSVTTLVYSTTVPAASRGGHFGDTRGGRRACRSPLPQTPHRANRLPRLRLRHLAPPQKSGRQLRHLQRRAPPWLPVGSGCCPTAATTPSNTYRGPRICLQIKGAISPPRTHLLLAFRSTGILTGVPLSLYSPARATTSSRQKSGMSATTRPQVRWIAAGRSQDAPLRDLFK
jgi:hypothetical protein